MAAPDRGSRDGIRLDSTTDSMEEVRASLGLPDEPASEEAATENAPPETLDLPPDSVSVVSDGIEVAPPAEAESEAAAPAETAAPDRGPRRRRRESADQRIGRAVAKQRDAERESERLRMENEQMLHNMSMLQQQPTPQQAEPGVPPVEGDPALSAAPQETPETLGAAPEPTESDFSTFDEYNDAHTHWREQRTTAQMEEVVERKFQERVEASQRVQADRAAEHREQAYQGRLDEARDRHADFDAVVSAGTDVPISMPMESVIRNTPGGADILYHLCHNPEVAQTISTLAPSAAVYEMGILAQQMGAASISGSGEPARASAASPSSRTHPGHAPAVHSSKRTPNPVDPVGGGSTTSSVPVDELSFQDYKAQRNRELTAREGY